MSTYGNNPSVPGYWSGAYQPDQLLCGPLQVVTKTVTITGGEVYQRGTVLGRMTESGAYTLCKQGAGVTDGSETPVRFWRTWRMPRPVMCWPVST